MTGLRANAFNLTKFICILTTICLQHTIAVLHNCISFLALTRDQDVGLLECAYICTYLTFRNAAQDTLGLSQVHNRHMLPNAVHEGSSRCKKVQGGSRRLKKFKEGTRGSKRFKKVN